MHWVKIPLFNWVKVKKDVIDIESRTWREVRERSGETKNCFMQLNIECFNGTEKHHRHNANRWSWILKIAVVPFLCFLPLFFFEMGALWLKVAKNIYFFAIYLNFASTFCYFRRFPYQNIKLNDNNAIVYLKCILFSCIFYSLWIKEIFHFGGTIYAC